MNRRTMLGLGLVCLSLTMLGLSSCSSEAHPLAPLPLAAGGSWVVSWGAPPEGAAQTSENQGGTDQTFRSFFYPTVSGTVERLRFSNFFGTTPVTITSARLAIALVPPAIDPTEDAPVLFSGSPSITIAPGTEVTSDPVNITYTFGQKLAVTTYMQGAFPPLTQHESQSMVNYVTSPGAGDKTGDDAGTSFTNPMTEWFLLTAMDVYGQYQGTIALFGSSTIDGHASDYGDANAYPVPNVAIPGQDDDRPSDILARSLNAAGYHLGVLNAGILNDSAGPGTGSPSGLSGVDRINRDVLQQPAVRTVVIYLGQIDLRTTNCGEASEVEASLQNMVSQASASGVRVILATIPPASFCTLPNSPNSGPFPSATDPYAGDINPGPENPGNTQRHLVNTWIKSAGATLPGVVAIADFEAALADPTHPDFIIPNWNSGDNFHPNAAGYQAQTGAIPVKLILPD